MKETGAVSTLSGASHAPTPLEPAALELREVTKTYPLGRQDPFVAVRGVSLEVARGQFVVITGRSGSGKTTLLSLAAGLARPTLGQVLWGGVDVWGLSDARQSLFRNQTIGFIFQFPSLVPSLTTLENVLLPTAFGAREARAAAGVRARSLLETVGLGGKLESYPRQLSKGQQQRVVIARSLVNDPQILIADEATSDLDEQTEREIMALLKTIHESSGITVLLVTHSSELVAYGTRALTMADGALVDPDPSRRR